MSIHVVLTDAEPDYRFTLANERTFLAYIRTAIALDGAGLAVVQFLTSVGNHNSRLMVGIALAFVALGTTLTGYHRWQSVQAAMRRDGPLPSSYVPLLLTIILASASVASAIALALR